MSIRTNPEMAYVYVMEEFSNDERIPAQKLFRKIGVALESLNDDPLWERKRKFHQGNVRTVKEVYSLEIAHPMFAKERATEIEKIAHRLLHDRGFASRHMETKTTGHAEWFEVSREEAIQIVNDAHAQWLEPGNGVVEFHTSSLVEHRLESRGTDHIHESVKPEKIVHDLFQF